MAERYLVRDKNELQVFYSFDKEGRATVPRVVTVVNANRQLVEVRGVAPEENLDPYIGSIVEAKLKEFPDGEAYKKKSVDMKMLTAIEQKVKHKQELAKDDLVFLYEINAPIEGFGYSQDGKCSDPRVAELRKQRNTEQDMLIVFQCTKEQIARNPGQINKNTKAYVGKLEPGIFTKLSEDIEHIYTSFPEKKIRRTDIEIGGKTAAQLDSEQRQKGIQISPYAGDMMDSDDFKKALLENPEEADPAKQILKKPEKITLIRLTVADLGFTGSATTDQIYKRAGELGLELCPAEVGPHYRLQYQSQPMNEWLRIAMKPIAVRYRSPNIFDLERKPDGLWLDYYWAYPTSEWDPDRGFVFCLRKSKT